MVTNFHITRLADPSKHREDGLRGVLITFPTQKTLCEVLDRFEFALAKDAVFFTACEPGYRTFGERSGEGLIVPYGTVTREQILELEKSPQLFAGVFRTNANGAAATKELRYSRLGQITSISDPRTTYCSVHLPRFDPDLVGAASRLALTPFFNHEFEELERELEPFKYAR